VEFLGWWNWVDFLDIGCMLVKNLDWWILVDFLDLSLGLKQQVIRHFYL